MGNDMVAGAITCKYKRVAVTINLKEQHTLIKSSTESCCCSFTQLATSKGRNGADKITTNFFNFSVPHKTIWQRSIN